MFIAAAAAPALAFGMKVLPRTRVLMPHRELVGSSSLVSVTWGTPAQESRWRRLPSRVSCQASKGGEPSPADAETASASLELVDTGGGGSNNIADDRPEKPDGDPIPGAILAVWRDFADNVFSPLPVPVKSTIMISMWGSPFAFVGGYTYLLHRIYNYKGSLVNRAELEKMLNPLVTSKELDDKLKPINQAAFVLTLGMLGTMLLKVDAAEQRRKNVGRWPWQ